MKFTNSVLAGSLAITLSAGMAIAGEKWDMPMAYNDGNFHTINGKLFADAVKTCTGGELDITVHGGGSLFKGGEIKRAVQTGQAQIGERLLSAHANQDAVFGYDSVPFMATSFEQSEKLKKAAESTLSNVLEKQNMVLLYSVPWPPQGLYFKKEINSTADMKGIKFRAYNSATARLAELSGMLPVQIEAAELVQALATGVADSFISSGSTGYDKKVWEHLTHFYDTQAWLPRNTVFANKKSFDALPEHSRNCLKSSAMLASAAGTARSEQLTGWYLAQLAENGMKVAPPGSKLQSELQKIGATMSAEWGKAAGANGSSIIDAYNKMK
ncbi:MAG: TRAP transporter substrate-binding protein [Gammaproteobacteria bacterium]|nr:TRAP transporter substrate-binding protein [Gammaproteobacteria bacterium]